MKKIFLTLAIALASYAVYAQTNTFPSSGNVGIGTSSPANALNIVANSASYADPQYSSGLRINDPSNTSALVMGVAANYENGYIQTVQPNVSWATQSLIFQPMGGNVGIGTNSPKGKLDVNGAIVIPGSVNNIMTRPAVSSTRITGEITGYSSSASVLDDGFLRLSAGGGTNPVKSYIDLSGFSLIPDMYQNITMGTSGSERIRITSSGNVGIGTATPDAKLAVNGSIHAKEVKVDLTGWPDYVFKPAYKLPTLKEVEIYIDKNKHLPDIQSEQEVAKNGINLGEVNKLLLKKVEELTLYLIEQDKRINKLETQLKIKNKAQYR